MNTITHCLLPVIAVSLAQRHHRSIEHHLTIFSTKELCAIGLFGAAPDIINPHLSLAARLTSWSHGLPFFGFLILLVISVRIYKPQILNTHLSLCLLGAYLLHLTCDAIAGGLAWLYPFNHSVIGDYYYNPIYWIPTDGVCLLTIYALYRALPKIRKAHSFGLLPKHRSLQNHSLKNEKNAKNTKR